MSAAHFAHAGTMVKQFCTQAETLAGAGLKH